MATNVYPLPAFSFRLSFSGITDNNDFAFQEASGIEVSMGVEEVVCGGQNDFHYKLPQPAKYSNLVLKRGLFAFNSKLVTWCNDTFQNGFVKTISPKTVNLKLLDESGKPAITWTLYGAYPVKWTISDFKAQENALSIETIELAYQYFKQKT